MRPTDVGGSRVGAPRGVIIFAALALAAAPLAGQAGWEAPRMLGPTSLVSPGAAWVRADLDAGEAEGVVGMWRPPGVAAPLSLRGGVLRDADGDPVAMAGLDLRVPLARRAEGARLDLAWSTGAGLSVGSYTRVSVPVDLLVGRAWASGSVWLSPYLSGGLVMDLDLGGGAPDQEFHVRPTAGAGLDLSLDRERRVVVRAGAALGSRSAFGLGAVVRP